jgi:hypothetical protein
MSDQQKPQRVPLERLFIAAGLNIFFYIVFAFGNTFIAGSSLMNIARALGLGAFFGLIFMLAKEKQKQYRMIMAIMLIVTCLCIIGTHYWMWYMVYHGSN